MPAAKGGWLPTGRQLPEQRKIVAYQDQHVRTHVRDVGGRGIVAQPTHEHGGIRHGLHHVLDAKARFTNRQEIEAAIVTAEDRHDPSRGSDIHGRGWAADFRTGDNERDAERRSPFDTAVDQVMVAWLEDV